MTPEEIKSASERVFESLFSGAHYRASFPEYQSEADVMTKLFKYVITEKIEKAISGEEN